MIATELHRLESALLDQPTRKGTPLPTPSSCRQEARLQADIDALKDPIRYKTRFESPQVQQLSQAIDILGRLQSNSLNVTSLVAYDKLKNARRHLDKLLKEHFDEE